MPLKGIAKRFKNVKDQLQLQLRAINIYEAIQNLVQSTKLIKRQRDQEQQLLLLQSWKSNIGKIKIFIGQKKLFCIWGHQ